MSLNYELKDISNYKTVCLDAQQGFMLPETERVIFMTMALDLGTITVKNVDEWMFRWSTIEILERGIGSVRFSKDALKQQRELFETHIGLRTNVPTTTRAAFMRKIQLELSYRAAGVVKASKKREEAA